MGASDSFPLPRYSCCIRPENPDSYLVDHRPGSTGHAVAASRPWSRRHRRNVSATFSLTDSVGTFSGGIPLPAASNNDVINVNTATEEELMTLSGICRQVARNIVDYRRRIGGFRKVEDVAVVSGVGASRLAMIRSELCVGPRSKARDDGSSMSSSGIGEDLLPVPVDINAASAAELAQVPLIGQSLADHIVEYRSQRGLFTDLDDLLIVGGVTVSVLAAIRQYLTLTDSLTVSSAASDPDDEQRFIQDLVNDFRQSFGPKPRRRHVANPLPAVPSAGLRLATWNLDQCGSLKMANPGVREVIAMTIIENRFNLIAVQGITDKCVLKKLCSELNEPALQSVRKWTAARGHWRYTTTSDMANNCIGLVYNVDDDIIIQTTQLADLFLPVSITHVMVRCIDLQFVLVNIFLPDSASAFNIHKFLPRLATELANFDETKVVFVGNLLQSDSELLQSISGSVTPVIPVVDINSTPAAEYNADNIWLNQALCSHSYIGKSGVITEGLSSLWIPNGWQFGGVATRYSPLWVDLIATAPGSS